MFHLAELRKGFRRPADFFGFLSQMPLTEKNEFPIINISIVNGAAESSAGRQGIPLVYKVCVFGKERTA